MALDKKVDVDIDGDGVADLKLDLKTIIIVVGGIISITMTYSALTKQIELNKQEIEVAKQLPPSQSHDIINQKITYLEEHLEKLEKQHDKRIDALEGKVYKR